MARRLSIFIYVTEVFEKLLKFEPLSADTYLAPPSPEGGQRTFGGQFLCHSLKAAQLTVEAPKFVHSSHSYFLRHGDVDKETTLRVERIKDGRSFSSRQVTAIQGNVEVFRTLLSFHIPETGFTWQPEALEDLPGPDDDLITYSDYWESQLGLVAGKWHGRIRPIEIRYINPPMLPENIPITEPQLMWMRMSEPIGENQQTHECALAYMADATLIDHVTLPHGKRWQDERLTGTSLDHAMWFHQVPKADTWLLYKQSVESTSGARGLATGKFLNHEGLLIASCMQEGLMRWDFG